MVFFQICNRTHSDCLPFVDSPQFWGMVSCNWWCLSCISTLKQNHWKRICSLACQNNSSLPLWSPFPVCIWPVYTRLYPPFCKHLLWPDGAVTKHCWCLVMSFWFKVCIYSHTRGVKLGLGLGFMQTSQVLSHWLNQSFSFWTLPYTQRHCHVRIEKGPVQTVAIILEAHNFLEYHYML